jgi:hypothetical protein
MIAPAGAAQITITFVDFSTQSRNDFVRVFECSDIGCLQQRQIAELSGTYSNIQAVTSATGFMKVDFTSDATISYEGFKALWNSVRTRMMRL